MSQALAHPSASSRSWALPALLQLPNQAGCRGKWACLGALLIPALLSDPSRQQPRLGAPSGCLQAALCSLSEQSGSLSCAGTHLSWLSFPWSFSLCSLPALEPSWSRSSGAVPAVGSSSTLSFRAAGAAPVPGNRRRQDHVPELNS